MTIIRLRLNYRLVKLRDEIENQMYTKSSRRLSMQQYGNIDGQLSSQISFQINRELIRHLKSN